MQEPKTRPAGTAAIAVAALAALVAGLVGFGMTHEASAQGWWPWASESPPQQRPPPVPSSPVYRPDPTRPPQAGPPPPGYPAGPPVAGNRPPICLQLEQRLVGERQRGTLSRDQLPKLEADLRETDKVYRQALSRLERAECYDYFLFSKTLRPTRQCQELNAQVETSKRRLADLDAQRQQIVGTRDRSYEDDIVRDLARNGCGQIYQQEAQRRGPSNPFSSLWQDEESTPSGRGSDFGALPFATYRTICVRLCDGYFFPVSFSTLQTNFDRDGEECQNKCAAPAELFYYQNPGGTVDQAISARSQTPYTTLKTAFRYRKEYVQGCSCKQAEYTPSPADRGDRKAEAPPPASTARQAQR